MVKQQLLSSTAPLRALREALVSAGAPEDKAAKAVAELIASLVKAPAPVESPDMTPKEVSIFRHESDSTTQRKMRDRTYDSYLSGNDKRLITRESVLRDREACLAAGPRFGETRRLGEEASPEATKRRRGRPRKAVFPGSEGEGQPGSEGPPTTI
jgi:hypothetical protein